MADKIGGGRGRGKANGAAARAPAADRSVKPDDNLKAIEDAYASQLVSFITKIRGKQKEADEIKVQLDAKKEEVNQIFGLAKGAGFTRKRLTALLADIGARHRDLQKEEEQRAKDRGILGLPVGSQMSLFESMPIEEKDKQGWRADGYLAGLRGDEGAPPKECPARFIQVWMEGYHDGVKVIASSMAMTSTAAAPPPATADDDEGDEDEPEGDGFEMSDEERGAQIGRAAEPEPEAV